ncbi:hypothetical protein [Labrenzia sp. VG12]|uniref:hypothetical protein n=1 Tax=Labrenzia sp. VG12 TaxID=2021862 RepID=UPI0012FD75D2|nr:hypothetical protein [Labrenzia sp. VG12]
MHMKDANTGKRTVPATRARLRAGKLRTMSQDLIGPCTLYDLKNGNTGLILPGEAADLPDTFYIEDEGDMCLGLAHVQQRARPHIEIAYLEAPTPLHTLTKRSA